MRLRLSSLAVVLAFAALVLSGCGGSGKPRPDLLFVSTRSGVYDIYAMNADGKHQQRVTRGSESSPSTPEGLFYALDPAWSANGRSIAFSTTRTGTFQVFVMDADGRNATQVTTGTQESQHPTWSPDGKHIGFVRGNTGAIYVMNVNGTGAHRVTHGTGAESDPAWSPNGRWIAFVRVTINTPVREVWLVHPDGSGAHMLTSLAASVGSPAWSPDSSRVVFSSDARGGHFAIYTIGVGGIGLRLVSSTSVDSVSPSWSPDGKTIVFARGGAIVTAPVEGGADQAITNTEDNDSSPAWNPVQAPAKKGY